MVIALFPVLSMAQPQAIALQKEGINRSMGAVQSGLSEPGVHYHLLGLWTMALPIGHGPGCDKDTHTLARPSRKHSSDALHVHSPPCHYHPRHFMWIYSAFEAIWCLASQIRHLISIPQNSKASQMDIQQLPSRLPTMVQDPIYCRLFPRSRHPKAYCASV
ncbi:hypothetical protein EDD86DRAFT_197708 [Gorgonomyces haynaldii]|nr:hypothetical protein EDD86DRAFT_197708 [Gorgonomyces haynaldii]